MTDLSVGLTNPPENAHGFDAVSGLVVERITTVEGVQRLVPDWAGLFDRVPDALPFASPEWTLAWWAHLRRDSWRIRDTLELHAVRTREGELVAVAPMMRTDRPGMGPLPIRAMQFLGTDANITEVRGMLAAPAYEQPAALALAGLFRERHSEWDWVQWSGLRAGSATLSALLALGAQPIATPRPAFVLDLPPTWAEFRTSVGRNAREALRKCYNSLKRDGHTWRFTIAESPGDVARALERFLTLHAMRAAATGTIAHADCFATEAGRRFLFDVCARLSEQGSARVFGLEIAGEVVAARVAFVFRDRMFLYYSGYPPEWGRYSVMTTVLAEALQYAIGAGIKSVNLSTGIDRSKTRWRPTQIDYVEVVMQSPGARARLAYGAYELARRRREARTAPPPPTESSREDDEDRQ